MYMYIYMHMYILNVYGFVLVYIDVIYRCICIYKISWFRGLRHAIIILFYKFMPLKTMY